TNGNYASQTVSFIHTTGNEIWVNVNFNKVTDSVNQVLGFSLSLFDITEIKEAENKILAQNEVLKKIAWTQSHIVRKPLANILAISELVKMEMVAQGFTTETIDSLMNS